MPTGQRPLRREETASVHDDEREDLQSLTLVGQGLYFALTGVWALVSIRTFMAVTGPKTDVWLVKTVGLLVLVIGAVLTMAGLRRRTTPENVLLAAGSASALTLIDVYYVARRRISPIYLLDAVAEIFLITLLALTTRSRPRRRRYL
jgi:FtsH-binding integral membrane protein